MRHGRPDIFDERLCRRLSFVFAADEHRRSSDHVAATPAHAIVRRRLNVNSNPPGRWFTSTTSKSARPLARSTSPTTARAKFA